MLFLFFVGLFLLSGLTVNAEDPQIYLTLGNGQGYPGELVELPVYVQTLVDSLDGFQISLSLSRPDLIYFEVDTVDVDGDTSFVCMFDTTGTLASGWQHVEARSIIGRGLELRLSGISDIGSGETPGIPDFTDGILLNIFARVFPDIPDTLTDRIAYLSVHTSTSYFSNQAGELILPIDVTDGSVTVAQGRRGDVNCDSNLNPVDVVFLVNYVYKGRDVICSEELGDINCDGNVNPVDVVFLVNYVYKSWPFPEC